MTKGQQIAVGLGLIGLGAVVLNRSRKDEPAGSVLAVGVTAGVAIGAVWLLSGENALSNGKTEGTGTLPPKAVMLLDEVAETVELNGLYNPVSSGGVKVGPLPDQPSIINQDDV